MTSALVYEEPSTYGEEVVNQDGLWKKVIGDLFEDFLLFFAPELHKEVDFTKTPDFLQQELFQEILEKKKGTNYADQIVKVHLKDGKEKWILVHIEVEASANADFSKRMFKYFYRIFDKFDREIVAFAVMTGPSVSEKTLGFSYSYFGTTLDYAYNVHKVSDYNEEELVQSNRLFSKIVLATKYMHKTKNKVDQRYRFKMKLMREVLKLEGHSRVSITATFYFIDYLFRLPEELRHEFTDTLRLILGEEGQKMVQYESGNLSPTLADLVKIERKEALEEGIEQGIETGLVAGEERIKKSFALTLLQEDFEVDYIAKLTKLSVAEVKKLKETLM